MTQSGGVSMGEAVQVLDVPVISVLGETLLVGIGAQSIFVVPAPSYPFTLHYVAATALGAAQGPFDIFLTLDGTLATAFYSNLAINSSIDVLASPAQAGGLFLAISGNMIFTNQQNVLTGPLTLIPFPALKFPGFPSISIIINNNTGQINSFVVELGLGVEGRGMDVSPILYPGLGPASTVSSLNI